ncbi:MAG: hypothetical protein R3264_03055, partial [Anaerolineae bacterium]|nr:hypothetical protein [Anaerolineae bacterium]
GAPVADDTSGATLFPVDENGIHINVIPAFQTVTITFDSIVKLGVSAIQNTAITTSPDIPTEVDPGGVDVPIEVARYELDKRVIQPANQLAKTGEEVIFGITITNTGNLTITKLPLQDTFIEDDLSFVAAQPLPPDSQIPAGVLTWNDLIGFFGPLLPSNRVALTLTFVVDPIPPSRESTQNIALVSGAEADDIPLPPLDDDVRIFFPTPPGKEDTTDDEGDPTPLPKAPPNPPDIRPRTTPDPNAPVPPGSGAPGSGGGDFSPPGGAAQPTGTVLPVVLLPETGERSVAPTLWPLLAFVIVGGWIFWVVSKHIRDGA